MTEPEEAFVWWRNYLNERLESSGNTKTSICRKNVPSGRFRTLQSAGILRSIPHTDPIEYRMIDDQGSGRKQGT